MGFLVTILVALIVVAVVCWIIQLVPVPAGAPWIKTVAYIVVAVVFLIWLLGWSGIGESPHHGWGLRRW